MNGSIHHVVHRNSNTHQQEPKSHMAYGTCRESVRLGIKPISIRGGFSLREELGAQHGSGRSKPAAPGRPHASAPTKPLLPAMRLHIMAQCCTTLHAQLLGWAQGLVWKPHPGVVGPRRGHHLLWGSSGRSSGGHRVLLMAKALCVLPIQALPRATAGPQEGVPLPGRDRLTRKVQWWTDWGSAGKLVIGLPQRMWLPFPLCISPEGRSWIKNPSAKVALKCFRLSCPTTVCWDLQKAPCKGFWVPQCLNPVLLWTVLSYTFKPSTSAAFSTVDTTVSDSNCLSRGCFSGPTPIATLITMSLLQST